MTYQELYSKLRDNHFYPDYEELIKKSSRQVTGLRINAFGLHQAQTVEKRISEVLDGIKYKAVYMPNQEYILLTLQ